MKLIISNFKRINSSILKVLYGGLKFCFILALFAAFILSLYHSIHNIDLFIIGISLLKSSLFFTVFFIICTFSIDTIKKDSINLAIKFARKYNIILLLKGDTTIITDGDITYLVKRGCPGMATAGSGDVLSGILVGMHGYNNASVLSTATCAYLAGVAGELAQEKYTDIAMKASDTIEFIPSAIKYIRNGGNL